MLTNANLFNLIEKARAFIVVIGLIGLPKRKIVVLRFAIYCLFVLLSNSSSLIISSSESLFLKSLIASVSLGSIKRYS